MPKVTRFGRGTRGWEPRWTTCISQQQPPVTGAHLWVPTADSSVA